MQLKTILEGKSEYGKVINVLKELSTEIQGDLTIGEEIGSGSASTVYELVSSEKNYVLRVTNMGEYGESEPIFQWSESVKIADRYPNLFPIIYGAWLCALEANGEEQHETFGFLICERMNHQVEDLESETMPMDHRQKLLQKMFLTAIRIGEQKLEIDSFMDNWMYNLVVLDTGDFTYQVKIVDFDRISITERPEFCQHCRLIIQGPPNVHILLILSNIINDQIKPLLPKPHLIEKMEPKLLKWSYKFWQQYVWGQPIFPEDLEEMLEICQSEHVH